MLSQSCRRGSLFTQRLAHQSRRRSSGRGLPDLNEGNAAMTQSTRKARCAVNVLAEGGRRLVATRPINPGRDVISEAPVISAPSTLDGRDRTWAMVRALLADAEKMTWLTQAGFRPVERAWDKEDESIARGIARDYGADALQVQDLYLRIAINQTACFDEAGQLAAFGLYATICFARHSCAPNTMLMAPRSRVSGAALRAFHPIAAGDEITWNYAWPRDLSMVSYAERQRLLYQLFGFRCRCIRCRDRA